MTTEVRKLLQFVVVAVCVLCGFYMFLSTRGNASFEFGAYSTEKGACGFVIRGQKEEVMRESCSSGTQSSGY